MRFLISVFTLFLFSPMTWSTTSFSGYIVQNGGQRALKTTTQQYILLTENNDVKLQLLKLHTNDFISGIGELRGPALLRLDTIDFVGLSNFIGTWMSPMGIFRVQDFSSLSLYTPNNVGGAVRAPQTSSLNYSIFPNDGASWGMFLTDANQIYFSNLTMNESTALIRFFDTQTGAFQKELTLSKISR